MHRQKRRHCIERERVSTEGLLQFPLRPLFISTWELRRNHRLYPGSSIPLANNLFFSQWEAINWNCSTQDAMFDGHLRLSLLPSGKLYVHMSGEQRWSVWFTVTRASGVFDLNFLKSFTTERNILFDPMNFFFFLPRKEVIQWLYGDDL